MKKLTLLLALMSICSIAKADNVRFDYIASTTTGTGSYIPLLVIPGTPVSFYTGCSSLPCLTKATTYTSAIGSSCPTTTAQIVLQLTNTCVSTADSQGNFGGWFASGTYQYTETVAGVVYGPYNFTVGSGGGGSGTVNSGTAFGLTYYPANGNAVSGDTPFNGIPFVSTTTAPVAATSTNLASILQTSTGCNSAGFVYLPQSNTCVAVSGVTNLSATAPITVSASTGLVTIAANTTGNATKVVTSSAAGTPGNCPTWNSGGNLGDAGFPCSSGGSGSVTSFGSGNAAPLFTTSVANSTTTPVLSFSLSNFPANTIYGNNTALTGSPAAVSINTNMLPFSYVGTTSILVTGSGSYVSGDCLQLNSSLNAIDVPCPAAGGGPPSGPIGSVQVKATSSTFGSYTTSGIVKIVSSSPTNAVQGIDYEGSGLCTVSGASSITLDGTTCSNFIITLGTNVGTVTLANFVANQYYDVVYKQDGTGGRTCAAPSSMTGYSGCSATANANTDYFTQYKGTSLIVKDETIY